MTLPGLLNVMLINQYFLKKRGGKIDISSTDVLTKMKIRNFFKKRNLCAKTS